MYPLIEVSASFEMLNQEFKSQGCFLVSHLSGNKYFLSPSETLKSESQVVKVKSGSLGLYENKDLIILFEKDEVVFPQAYQRIGLRLGAGDLPVGIEEYSFEEIFKSSKDSPQLAFCEYFLTYLALQMQLIQSLWPKKIQLNPELRPIEEGEYVIKEGTEGDEVFTLIEGRAQVEVQGVKVGHVLEGEIFGALAALTQKPRSASVKTETSAMVQVVPAADFLQLIRLRPESVMRLVLDMAKTIQDLNHSIVSQQKKSI